MWLCNALGKFVLQLLRGRCRRGVRPGRSPEPWRLSGSESIGPPSES